MLGPVGAQKSGFLETLAMTFWEQRGDRAWGPPTDTSSCWPLPSLLESCSWNISDTGSEDVKMLGSFTFQQ